MELRRLGEDLRTEGITLIPYPPGPPWVPHFFPFDIDEFEELLGRCRFDWPELEYWWYRRVHDWPESAESLWPYYREHLPETLRDVQRLIERRMVSGVVLVTSTGFEAEPMEYELQQISELLLPRAVLHLEMGRPEREERPLFPGIRSLRLPEDRNAISAALRALGHDRVELAPLCLPSESVRVELEKMFEARMEWAADSEHRTAAGRPKSIMSRIGRWFRAKPEPDAVNLGASAPTRVRPGDEFMARFSAYHPAFAKEAKRALKQPGAKTDPNQFQTTWKKGEEVRVVLVGEHLTAAPSEQMFTWDGMLNTVQFDVKVDADVTRRRRVLLKFDVYIQEAVVARVRLRLTIDSKPGFLEQLLVPEQQFLAELAPQTAYASYAAADMTVVQDKVEAIAQHAGIRFFTECLSLEPREERKRSLLKKIGEQDLFMLFWSWAAAKSDDVTWEWRTALKRPGKDRMQAQRLMPQDPKPVLPPELQELGTSKGQRNRMQQTDKKYFIVGCVLSIFVAGLVIWGFALGTMTPDQRWLMRILLSLFSGFAAASFVGSFTVKARGLIPGVVTTATGGFGVWLLTAFVMVPSVSTFGVIVQPHGPAGILDIFKDGTVSLQVGAQLRRQSIDEGGQARFQGISSEFEGERVPVGVEISDFQLKDPEQKLELRQARALAVPMVPKNP